MRVPLIVFYRMKLVVIDVLRIAQKVVVRVVEKIVEKIALVPVILVPVILAIAPAVNWIQFYFLFL